MSNLKNTYGFSSSLLDAIRSVHETSNQQIDEISTGKVVHTRTGADGVEYHIREDSPTDYSIYRKRPNGKTGKTKHIDTYGSLHRAKSVLDNEVKEEHNPELDKLANKYSEQILKARDSAYPEAHEDEAGYILKKIKTQHGHEAVRYARAHAQKNLNDVHRKENEKSKADTKANYKPTSGPAYKQYKEEFELDEADHTYPFKANQLAPLVVQLRSLLNFLSKSGALKKSMREHAELVEAYIGEEITEEQLEEMISFVDDLMEGRPKGSKNKSKMASAPKPEARAERGKSEEDEDYEDAYPVASRDGRHIIPELNAAAGDKKGAKVQTSSGQRHVSQHVAGKMVSHLMSLKPAERGEHSAHIFNGSVPKVKTLNHVKTNVLIKQMGSEKKIGSDAGVKRGRGRPKKAV